MTPTAEPRTRSLGSLLNKEFPPRQRLLGDWLIEKHPAMMWAPAGVGKTMLSLSIGLAVAGGGRLFGWDAPEPRRVLYVDGEMYPEDLQDRCVTLIPAVEADPEAASENFHLLGRQDQPRYAEFPDLTTEEGRDLLMKKVEAVKPSLVVLDSWSTLCNVEDENEAAAFRPMMELMADIVKTRAAVILIHHARKNADSYRGSSMMSVSFESMFGLRRPDVAPKTGTAFELRWEKNRRAEAVENLEASFTDGKWVYRALEDEDLKRLVAAVKSLRYTKQTEIGEALDLSQSTVSRLLQRADVEKLLSAEQYKQCVKAAKEIQQGTADFDDEADDTEDF